MLNYNNIKEKKERRFKQLEIRSCFKASKRIIRFWELWSVLVMGFMVGHPPMHLFGILF